MLRVERGRDKLIPSEQGLILRKKGGPTCDEETIWDVGIDLGYGHPFSVSLRDIEPIWIIHPGWSYPSGILT